MNAVEAELFEIAARARRARASADLRLDFLQSVFEERGHRLTACQVMTVAYLSWYESALTSGVTWRDHVQRLAPDMTDCQPDEALRAVHANMVTQREARRRALEAAQVQQQRITQWGMVGGVSAAGVGLCWLIYRRLKVAEENALRDERRRRRRRSRSSSPQADERDGAAPSA